MTAPIRCQFELRAPSEKHPGKFVYTTIRLDGYRQDGAVEVASPPAIGDTVWLVGRGERGDTYRVIARDWMFPGYGSGDWPRGTPEPKRGPILRCLVERAEGFIQDEAPDDEEDSGS